ncbi:MAG: hypothetical protein RR495_02385 [Anaerovoracaceae bacterium]
MAKNKNKPKEINFYESYMYDPKAEAKKKAIRNAIIPLVLVLVLILGAFGYLKIDTIIKNKNTEELQAYIKAPENISEYEEAKLLMEERDILTNIYTELETTRVEMDKVPIATSMLMTEVESKLAGAKANSYTFDSASGKVVIDINTMSVRNVPMLIDNLQQISAFGSIDYKGYEGEDDGEKSNRVSYRAIITCKFNS